MDDYGADLFADAAAEEAAFESAGWKPQRRRPGWWWHPQQGELPADELRRRLARKEVQDGD